MTSTTARPAEQTRLGSPGVAPPVAPPITPPIAPAAADEPASPAAGADILVVDDYPENLLAIELILQDLGQRIVTADSGADALRKLLVQDFAVILLDVQMPGMDGFETAELIRGRQRSRHTPIIFVTAHDRSEAALTRGYRVGAVDFLYKPLVPEILRSKTAVFVELFVQREEIKRTGEQLRMSEQREQAQRLAGERDRWESERIRAEVEAQRRYVAELDRRAAQLAHARRAAEAASAAKSRFLANVSHELRTPLNAVIGYSEMLEEECNDSNLPQLVPDLRQIQSAGRHLLALVNDILDLSKVEAGRCELLLEAFDVCEVVNDVAVSVRPLVARENNRLEVRCGDAAGDGGGGGGAAAGVGTMFADVTKLRQSLFNLLSNAAKFTKHGVIELAVTREAGGAGGAADRLVFRVRDTGVGMGPDQLERLFQPFMQGDAATGRDYGGTGLGLAITKRFCELMGGEVQVTSAPGAGSTFTIVLPALVVAGAQPAEAPARVVDVDDGVDDGRDAGVRQTILVIDDDARSCEVTRRVLTRAGYRVETAGDGDAGLQRARSLRPAAVLLNCSPTHADGVEFLTALDAEPAWRTIPVVTVTTGDWTAEDRQRLNGHAVTVVPRGADARRLLSAIRDAVGSDSSSSPVR